MSTFHFERCMTASRRVLFSGFMTLFSGFATLGLVVASLLLIPNEVRAFGPKASPTSKEGTQPMLLTEHPLADSLWQPSSGERVTVNILADALGGADYVLLGEKHDNRQHHLLQFLMLSMALSTDRAGSITFEMVEPRFKDALADAVAAKAAALSPEADSEREERLAALGKALEWEARGWPDWGMYQQLFDDAFNNELSLHPGNPNRADLMALARGGTLSETMLQDLRWDKHYDQARRDNLLDELYEAHCSMMKRDMLTPLVDLQRFKDAHMARAMRHGLRGLRASSAKDPKAVSILIAGNGHVRKDRGVPYFLDEKDKIVSIALIEVVRDEHDVKSYPSFDPALYDFVWFTPRVDEIDPCDKFREQLERMKGKMGGKEHGKKQGDS